MALITENTEAQIKATRLARKGKGVGQKASAEKTQALRADTTDDTKIVLDGAELEDKQIHVHGV